MQVTFEKNREVGSFGGRAFIITTPTNACLTINNKTKEREETMSSFGEIASKFNKLGENKKVGNGLYLQTLW